jgi:osmotically-inducible protein OsmY
MLVHIFPAFFLLASVLALGGCGVVVGAGAAVGVTAMEDRGLEAASRDTNIEAQIINAWFNKNQKYVITAGVEVYNGRVLLTGAVDNANVRADLVRLAWTIADVKEVINEIQESSDKSNLAGDTWITTQIKAKITFDRNILAINYKIETVSGIVYLIGTAQNQAELDRVIGHARGISYVTNVISHVRIKGKV